MTLEQESRDRKRVEAWAVAWSASSTVIWLGLSVWLIVSLWPGLERLAAASSSGAHRTDGRLTVLAWHQAGSVEVGLIWLAAAFGVLGATAHCLYVMSAAISDRDFGHERIGWMLPQPLLGGVLGVMTVVALNAGLISGSSSASLSLSGAAAAASVAGLSARAAFKKLSSTPSHNQSPPPPQAAAGGTPPPAPAPDQG